MKTVDFKVFRAAADLPNGRVAALRVPGGGTLSRKEIDDYTAFVKIYGAGGLAYIKVNDVDEGERGRPAVADRQVPAGARAARDPRAHRRAERRPRSSSAPTARRSSTTRSARCAPRSATTAASPRQGWKPLWVVDFPMFEYDEEKKTWAARHHPFTAPKDGHEDLFSTDPGVAIAKAYDVVLNGWEIGGGSVRIHRPEVQQKVFAALGISPEDQQKKFGFLLERAAVRRAAARRHRVRPRPHRHDDVRRRVDPRRDRVPEDAARPGPADRRADAGHRAAAARPAHQGARRRTRSKVA